jgi:nitroreductase
METLKTLFTRQSVRSYLSNQISKEELDTLLKAALAAPTGRGKFGDIHLTVVQNEELLGKITAYVAKVAGDPAMKPFYGAPTVIIVSCIPNGNIHYANAACMVENMAIAATDLGLGSVYLWGFLTAVNQNPDLVRELRLPEGFVPTSALAVGHPFSPLPERAIPADKVGINFIY